MANSENQHRHDITEGKKAGRDLLFTKQSIDAAGEGIYWVDKDARIVNANLAGCRQLGYSKEELLSMTVHDIDPIFPKERWLSNWEELRQKGSLSFETLHRHKSGNIFPVEVRLNYIKYEDKEYSFVFVKNITKHKEAEEALQKSEHRYRTLVEVNPYGIQEIDTSGIITYTNPAYQQILGYTEQELLGKSIQDLLEPESRRDELRDYLSILVKEQPQPSTYYQKNRTKDDRIIDIAVDWNYNRDNEGLIVGFTSVITDITERKKAEEKLLDYQFKLKSLSAQLSITEERERRRIATKLHDQIGQSLVFSKLKIDELQNSANTSELKKALNEISNNIIQLIQDTRTLTFDLSSPILNEIGFEKAVASWLDEQIQEKHGINTEFEDDGQQKLLDKDIQSLLFRNVRELLVNVVKHANAQNVKVSVRKVDDLINISVEDNGDGFDPAEVASKATFGLFSIRERLEQLDGSFEIKSEAGHGSKITMKVPLKQT
jgi:PAS domain S-box-containing protein